MDLDLDEGMEIVFIMTTGKADMISIIVNNKAASLTYVITWDLTSNMEYT